MDARRRIQLPLANADETEALVLLGLSPVVGEDGGIPRSSSISIETMVLVFSAEFHPWSGTMVALTVMESTQARVPTEFIDAPALVAELERV